MRKHFLVEMKALDKTCIQLQLKCSLLSAECKIYGHAQRKTTVVVFVFQSLC